MVKRSFNGDARQASAVIKCKYSSIEEGLRQVNLELSIHLLLTFHSQ